MNKFTFGFVFLLFLSASVYSAGEGIAESSADAPDRIPVTGVTLYSAGLAQMVHETAVYDDSVLQFQADPKDINDILKSLVIEDLDGGTVDTVNFDSSDPLSVVLGDLRVNPSGSPSLTSFLRQTQGELITVTTASGEFSGRIFSVEERPKPAPAESGTYTALNLIDNGIFKSVDISTLYNLKYDDQSLQAELTSALETIAESRVKSVRTLKISFKGKGERRIRLSYIKAVPLWKTSYRIILDSDGTPKLEGWAIVQNTGSAAWKDIRLSFAAGQPNAFTMDLSTPRYVTRSQASVAADTPIGATEYERAYKSAAAPSASRAYDVPMAAMEESAADYDYGSSGSYSVPGIASQATGTRKGNFYKYEVNHPVTVGARSSAMIPILSYDEAGSSVGVYDPSYDVVFKGIRLENDSDAHWAAGPVTVIEGRSYGGDALLPDMIPGSSRLLTYAVHGTLEVLKESSTSPRKLTGLRISDGILYRTDKMERETSYIISGDEKELIIIHPKESGWKLIDSPEISEQNNSEYRFSLSEWKSPVKVREEYVISNQYRLLNFQFSDLNYYIEWDGISAEMKAVFKKIAELKRDSDSIRSEISGLNDRLNRINRDQSRIRENMKVLDKSSQLFIDYADQLSSQEEEITALNEAITGAGERLKQAEARLNSYISGIDL